MESSWSATLVERIAYPSGKQAQVFWRMNRIIILFPNSLRLLFLRYVRFGSIADTLHQRLLYGTHSGRDTAESNATGQTNLDQ